MSAASRARAEAARQKLLHERWPDIPPPDAPPTSIDEELEQRLTWFIENQQALRQHHSNETFQCTAVYVTDEQSNPMIIGRRIK